jgi:phosphate transport system ATP-binding protein
MYGKTTAVKGATLSFAPNQVHALIGPSGCGKSTFLRTLNRMHELVEGGWITGRVLLDGQDIYDPSVNAMQLRRKVGMVFQRPTPFPTMSIYDNVAAGLRLNGRLSGHQLDEIVERSLHQAALWDEVKDRLKANAMGLSGGQQQRLCVARTIAPSPDVVLLDEPTASLDPARRGELGELLRRLAQDGRTLVIATHDEEFARQHATRIVKLEAGVIV